MTNYNIYNDLIHQRHTLGFAYTCDIICPYWLIYLQYLHVLVTIFLNGPFGHMYSQSLQYFYKRCAAYDLIFDIN